MCSAEEKLLDEKDRKGLCHYVGTYCSDKVLGVCTSKRKSYCCFESKLSRILQEQGRAQIGKSWGKAKNPDCKGFLIEEFQKLDLSKMDFTEVYSEFIDAAKVPDEVQTSIEIQDKIDEYYKLHAGTGAP
jgi:conjugal transfer mating pair stabilization protein TraN